VRLFVDEMKAGRAQRKWTQAELARQAHCSESSIAMVESYQRPPTASVAKALDNAFGTSGTYARMERGLRNLPFPASFRSLPVVMHDQLAHLVGLSGKPNVTIQVVPYDAGGHSGLLGAFVIADRPSATSIVFIEDVTGGRVCEDAATVAEVVLRFNALRSEALPNGASRTLMEGVAESGRKRPR
jgi:transcriptional regulator with XRE-family HTH domain